ncbi:hypothetical protein PR003_g33208 [Phytophthora rubi]|uniref:Ankyrin repeat protein n=1 Tax=Phytophthora rubi TaxID=129364 RepID=A0A6A4AWG0_9STRA|nr:hypothetical protein PR002_g31818 [Phytophthora rubi]KAE9263287.1 hypothetical protein PR003_g33208 [Phytophthora rubi]
MKAAVGSGDVALVEWLLRQEILDASEGTEILELLPSEGTQEAAANGHLEMLKWIREKGNYDREISAGTLLKAAENGHMDIVHWIIDTDRK